MLMLLTLAWAAPVVVSGDRDPLELIDAARRQTEVAACFRGDLSIVEVDLVVRASGQVKKAKAKTGPKEVRACVEEELRSLTLFRTDGTAKLHWSLSLAEVSSGVLGALYDAGLHTPGEGVGGLIGVKGTQIGSGGLGSRGAGLGGGGPASGLGGLGSLAGATHTPTKSGLGGDPIILGALDRAHMDDVIRAAVPDVLACRTADQQGRVVIKLFVDSEGKVTEASTKTSTMNAPDVEACIVDVIGGLTFDPPKGGGIVIASYPFFFIAD